jgi:hypothetical protein
VQNTSLAYFVLDASEVTQLLSNSFDNFSLSAFYLMRCIFPNRIMALIKFLDLEHFPTRGTRCEANCKMAVFVGAHTRILARGIKFRSACRITETVLGPKLAVQKTYEDIDMLKCNYFTA